MTECAENFSSSFNGEEQGKVNGFLATLPLSDEEVSFLRRRQGDNLAQQLGRNIERGE